MRCDRSGEDVLIDAELLDIKKKEEDDILDLPGVTGVGLRNRRIMVYVQDKSVAEKLPVSVQGVPVSAVVTGTIKTLSKLVSPYSIAAFSAPRTDKWRPAVGGVSIGSLDVTAGTAGDVYVRNINTGMPEILSNNHVLAQDWGDMDMGEVGKPIVQPGPYDGGSSADKIGSLNRWKRVEYTGNLIDAAIASVDNLDLVKDEVLDVGKIMGTIEGSEGMQVFKSGRTTGLTNSTITDMNATIKVQGEGTVELEDQIMTGFMAQGGDSGSLLCTKVNDQPYAVGLLHAGSDTVTVHCKWKHIRELLGVDIGGQDIPNSGQPPGIVQIIGAVTPLVLVGGLVLATQI